MDETESGTKADREVMEAAYRRLSDALEAAYRRLSDACDAANGREEQALHDLAAARGRIAEVETLRARDAEYTETLRAQLEARVSELEATQRRLEAFAGEPAESLAESVCADPAHRLPLGATTCPECSKAEERAEAAEARCREGCAIHAALIERLEARVRELEGFGRDAMREADEHAARCALCRTNADAGRKLGLGGE